MICCRFVPNFFQMKPLSISRPLLATYLLDPRADPFVFAFQRSDAHEPPAHVAITRGAWQALGPAQAIDYIVDRYLLENPEEEQRVGRGLVLFCVRYTLGFSSLNAADPDSPSLAA